MEPSSDLREAISVNAIRKLLPAVLLMLLLSPRAMAQMPQLRGYDGSQA